MGAVHGVGPGAAGIDVEGAIAVAANHVGLGDEGRGAVHVAGVEVAAGALGYVDLGQAGGAGAGDDRRIVAAGKGDLCGGPAQGAIPEADRIGEGVAQRLSCRERLQGVFERCRQRAGIVADLAIRGDPDPGAIQAGVIADVFESGGVLGEEIGGSIALGGGGQTLRVVQ
ncbi:hypothetical protein D3C85_787650 [compost metagenome]